MKKNVMRSDMIVKMLLVVGAVLICVDSEAVEAVGLLFLVAALLLIYKPTARLIHE
jgi:hypothetical protein